MSYRAYKFLVVAVIQELNEDDDVVRELSAEEPVTLFGTKGLRSYAETFELDLATKES